MYHMRFTGTHYEIGFKWGARLLRYGKILLDNVPFPMTQERIVFAERCRPFYEKWYPEALEEIKGIAEGQKADCGMFEAVLLSMYCILPDQKCSCFAFREGGHIVLARNSDFLTGFEKLSGNCIYRLQGGNYSFQGNTTAFVEMEDGINESGLAIGLTSVYPKQIGYGLNAGMLLRYGLEKCSSVDEFVLALKRIPIASSQTFTAVDTTEAAAVIECNADQMEVCYAEDGIRFVSAVNTFMLEGMRAERVREIDDWNAEERYETIAAAFCQDRFCRDRFCQDRTENAVSFAMDVLKGKYGFMCQYDRRTGKDTVWSVIYDAGSRKIYRCEGNPSRKQYVEDGRSAF